MIFLGYCFDIELIDINIPTSISTLDRPTRKPDTKSLNELPPNN